MVEFSASGSSTFADPRYNVRYRINDLFVMQEPVGLVTGTLALRGHDLSGELERDALRKAIS